MFHCLSCLFSFTVNAQVSDKPKGGEPKKTRGKTKKKAKNGVRKSEKASFKRSRGSCGVKAPVETSLKYGDYDLGKLPHDARPDLTKPNTGKHSYTLAFNGTVEVLLQKEAYFVKKVGDGGSGPTGQISWAKNGGPVTAFNLAKERAALKRPNA